MIKKLIILFLCPLLLIGATSVFSTKVQMGLKNMMSRSGAFDNVLCEEQTTEATPATGYGKFYFKTDGKPYAKNDAGTESDLTTSSSETKHALIRFVKSDTDTATGTTISGDIEVPFTGTLTGIGAYNDTAGTTGSIMTIDVHIGGATIMATNKITIDVDEKTSRTAATQPVLTTTAITAGDILTIDVDGIHTTAAKGGTLRLDYTIP